MSTPISWFSSRRTWWAILLVVVVMVVVATAAYVQRALVAVVRDLPLELHAQEHELSLVVRDLSFLVGSIEAARAEPSEARLLLVRQRLQTTAERTEQLRQGYRFDSLVGASAMHAELSPALSDIERWLADGLPGYRPESAMVLRLVSSRSSDALQRVLPLQDQAHEIARALLVNQERRLDRVRTAMTGLIMLVGLLVLGLVVLIVNQSRAIEQRRRVGEELRHAKEVAEHANRKKTEFFANMSHELRTPLNAVIGFAEVMDQGLFGPLGSPRYREYVADIRTSGLHLLNLINDILDVAKAEAGRIELEESEVRLDRLIDASLRLVDAKAREGAVRVETQDVTKLPPIRADERRLRQVLINLPSNAVKFTPAGGQVSIAAEADAKRGFLIRVKDTGVGIKPEDIPTALEPFGQVDSSLVRNHEGTGLGLPLSRALVELHGGRLDIESEVGVGTTVTVALPPERLIAA